MDWALIRDSLITSAVKEDTEAIRVDTEAIRGDTSQIPLIKQDTAQISVLVQEIASLRLQVTVLEQVDRHGGVVLQRFLDDTNSYAETVLDYHVSGGEDSNFELTQSTPRSRTPIQSSEATPADGIHNRDAQTVSHKSIATSQAPYTLEQPDPRLFYEENYPSPPSDVKPSDPSAQHPETSSTPNISMRSPYQEVHNSSSHLPTSGKSLADSIPLALSVVIPAKYSRRDFHPQHPSLPANEEPATPRFTIKGLVAHPKKVPDHAAIERSKLARLRLSPSEREKLDRRMATLIRDTKSVMERLRI